MTNSPPRILAIHAHPDDIELQCAGTLALLKDRGCEIVYCTMTAGDLGSMELSQKEIAAVRRGEAEKAAALLGAEYVCGEFGDLAIFNDDPSRRRVTEIIRKARPDIVITAPHRDYHCDHEATGTLVRDACFGSTIPNYKTHQWDPAPYLDHLPHLYYVDPVEGTDYYGNPQTPAFVIDISSKIDLKLEMLACHASQRDWLRKIHGMDEYIDSCRRWSATRGQEHGFEYGEGFSQHKGHPFPHDNLLKQILDK
ncbi:PIG-L deacetylase family protein [Rubinisphaera margarita]|uniref:PIG-L deacetylase family protein n=1 Tax=Rubinisphaera margarita TaxID=2909586 RepID=UPI001EE8AA56|nr:PIG-L family deacetylase [Rubinisphaera margarita]MCG6154525.1 PIG-L family deacetylase [Rubinisphaera margarita]